MADRQDPSRKNRRGFRQRGPEAALIQGERAVDFKGTMRKLARFMGRFKIQIVVLVVFAIGSTVFNIVGPRVLSTATTELFDGIAAKIAGTGGIDFEAVARILATTLVLYLVSAACSFVQSWLMAYVSQQTAFEMRRRISEKIGRMTLSSIEKRTAGDILSRITNDVDTLGQSLNQGLTQLITSTVTVVGVLAMMLSINVPMTLVAMLVIPVSGLFVSQLVKRSQKYFKAQQDSLGDIDARIEETFSGHEVVRAFNRQGKEVEEFDRTNDVLYASAWKSQFISGLMMPVMNFVANLGYVVVAVFGAYLKIRGVITVGDIQAFIQYVRNFTQPITQLAQVANVLQQMAAAAERVFEFLEADEAADAVPCASSSDIAGDVAFDHVRFGYDPARPVIADFSARIKAGQTVAIVGPTGAGKTTIVKLLMRFYDVQGGSIRLSGHDVRDFDREDLRSAFGMVLQDAWLFNGTIRENIRYGRLDATDEEVEAAARAAHADRFVRTLPHGYDTVINEAASNISSGQRQLLTISRAILADRSILVLDEATSSVDTRTEERIQKAMDNLMAGRTAFVIAHRLSTIRSADLVLVIDRGDVVEQGTHGSLLAEGGFYADLYNAQFEECDDVIESGAR